MAILSHSPDSDRIEVSVSATGQGRHLRWLYSDDDLKPKESREPTPFPSAGSDGEVDADVFAVVDLDRELARDPDEFAGVVVARAVAVDDDGGPLREPVQEHGEVAVAGLPATVGREQGTDGRHARSAGRTAQQKADNDVACMEEGCRRHRRGRPARRGPHGVQHRA